MLVVNSALSLIFSHTRRTWRTPVICKKDYGLPFEWESNPSLGTSYGGVLFPYFQNKAMNIFSDSKARTHGENWSLLFKSWYLWIFRFFSQISVVPPENLECPMHPDGSIGPAGDNTFKNLTAFHEKQHGIMYQMVTMKYQAPYVWRIICLEVSSHLLNIPLVCSSCKKRGWSGGCRNSIPFCLFFSSLTSHIPFSRTGVAHGRTKWCDFRCSEKDSLPSTDFYQPVHLEGLYYHRLVLLWGLFVI